MQKPIINMPLAPVKIMSDLRRTIVKSRTMLIMIFCTSLVTVNGSAVSREAHTHGVANVTLAFENGNLEVQFESPAISLLGFEHKPETQKQVEAIEKTKAFLNSAENVLSIDGGDCSSDSVNVNILGPAGQALNDNQKQEHGHHEGDDEHDKHSVSHSEVSAVYVFSCVNGEQLRSVTVSLFEYFSDLETVNVNWVTETQQGQSILQPKSSTIEFK